MTDDLLRPPNRLPDWDVAELPEPQPLTWRQWTRFIGPGIVMMGIQIGGGEWLLGPEVTAKYGGGLMWIATLAIVFQVFYNLECGRYALYCGEPITTGFMRTAPGPRFWMGAILFLSLSALIPGLSTHGAAMAASLWLDRPPTVADRGLVTMLAYVFLLAVALPVLAGWQDLQHAAGNHDGEGRGGAGLLFDYRRLMRQRSQLVECLQRIRQVRYRADHRSGA